MSRDWLYLLCVIEELKGKWEGFICFPNVQLSPCSFILTLILLLMVCYAVAPGCIIKWQLIHGRPVFAHHHTIPFSSEMACGLSPTLRCDEPNGNAHWCHGLWRIYDLWAQEAQVSCRSWNKPPLCQLEYLRSLELPSPLPQLAGRRSIHSFSSAAWGGRVIQGLPSFFAFATQTRKRGVGRVGELVWCRGLWCSARQGQLWDPKLAPSHAEISVHPWRLCATWERHIPKLQVSKWKFSA